MRTTIRLSDELYARVRAAAQERKSTVTSYIEQALQQALISSTDTTPAYRIDPIHGAGLQPGVDLDDSDRLSDLMDDRAGR
ncbi:ribbon-helix-helix protein, CopG family [Nocardioides acrostichi]|uniref:Ribbon-helix-helix protein, CopG family n=1 Tax=Nocardioides acrostichi TaxID=2784339 RepID=A0A930V1N6_9ACTN|nr:ribbon-helix-helix protein, CopG family [Nocardioides acrostichi]MBF4162122.1 ribbon-helix-helix protein, CopG family [Nocardioides acrostichi]